MSGLLFYNRHVAVHLRHYRLMRHMLTGNNVGLILAKKVDIPDWEHAFVSNHLIQHHTVSTKEVNYMFPLFLYPLETQSDIGIDVKARVPNLNANFYNN